MCKNLVLKGNLEKALILWNHTASRATPLSERIGHFSDEEPSKASLLKIIRNIFILNMVETLAEGVVFSEKTALGDKKFAEVSFRAP